MGPCVAVQCLTFRRLALDTLRRLYLPVIARLLDA